MKEEYYHKPGWKHLGNCIKELREFVNCRKSSLTDNEVNSLTIVMNELNYFTNDDLEYYRKKRGKRK